MRLVKDIQTDTMFIAIDIWASIRKGDNVVMITEDITVYDLLYTRRTVKSRPLIINGKKCVFKVKKNKAPAPAQRYYVNDCPF